MNKTIALLNYAPHVGDILVISRPYGGGIGMLVQRLDKEGWSKGVLADTHTALSCFGLIDRDGHLHEWFTLVAHREFELGWFYWIYRAVPEQKPASRRRWDMRLPFEQVER
jgi:hypothetical protein